MEALKDYTVHLDAKKRITLRGAEYQYYNVREFANGYIVLEPRELVIPSSISRTTMNDMDSVINNVKNGHMSEMIEFSDFVGVEADTVASDEDVMNVSSRIMEQNKEAYEVLAK